MGDTLYRERQSGWTSQQMREAPQGAVYVWCNAHLDYPRDLARHLRREDLVIVAPHQIEWPETTRYRTRRSGIVLDHAARLTDREFEGYRCLEMQMRPRGSEAP